MKLVMLEVLWSCSLSSSSSLSYFIMNFLPHRKFKWESLLLKSPVCICTLGEFRSLLPHLPDSCFCRGESAAWPDWWTSVLKGPIPTCSLRSLEPATVRLLGRMSNGSVQLCIRQTAEYLEPEKDKDRCDTTWHDIQRAARIWWRM